MPGKFIKSRRCCFCNLEYIAKNPNSFFCGLTCRTWAKVNRGKPNECWPWTGSRQKPPCLAYGTIIIANRLQKAHRVVFELAVRPLKPGEVVMHECDNPSCCNPSHLRGASHGENVLDCHLKGRHPMQKLYEVDVLRIYRMLELKFSTADIARAFDVSASTIRGVKSGASFKRLHHHYAP